MTNVFISWSGERSKQIAEELRRWIPSVLQFAKPYFTPSDIEKGTRWASEIAQKLADTNVGIICLTRENYERPWILFEAGALSKDLEKSKVCSVLFGMDDTDLSGPFTTLQTTSFDKQDFKKLLSTINDSGGESSLEKETFDNVFDMWWPKLEEKVTSILAEAEDEESEVRADREILEEILSLSRISARKSRTSIARLEYGPIVHLCKVAINLLNEAEIYRDLGILAAVEEMHDALEFISRKTGNTDEVIGSLEAVVDKMKQVRTSLDRPPTRDLDDEIPF